MFASFLHEQKQTERIKLIGNKGFIRIAHNGELAAETIAKVKYLFNCLD
jgi:hypothetical protein